MRDTTNTKAGRREYRRLLLTTVSAAALALSAYGSAEAADSDASQPLFWVELGGHFSFLNDTQEKVSEPFFSGFTAAGLDSSLKFEKPSRYSLDEFGKLTFQPADSDWQFSASVRIGRSSSGRHIQQKTNPKSAIVDVVFTSYTPPYVFYTKIPPQNQKFLDTQWASSEKHAVLDFQVGKDVGLGLFGRRGSSTLSAGVRIAQFKSRSQVLVDGDPTIEYPTKPLTNYTQVRDFIKYNTKQVYWLHDDQQRQFHGIGPSISWQGSAPVAGNPSDSEIMLDWGINAALLFGRQKAGGSHQLSSGECHHAAICHVAVTYVGPIVPHDRSRNITVPNIGGSLGLTFQTGDAKVSFGYRADLFVNAMDTGIDVRKSSNEFFHGPYASISIGLGD